MSLYQILIAFYPSIGAQVGLAAVLIESENAGEAIRILDQLPRSAVDSYQPYWVARAKAQLANSLLY